MRPVMRRLAAIALPVLILLLPASASAFSLTNCTLNLTSFDANGATIDTATVGDTDATQENPLLVDWEGTVQWAGTMGPLVIKDHQWGVSIFNLPTPENGGDANEDGDTDGDGTVRISEDLPFRVTGLYFVSGAISGTGGSCEGSGWIELSGDAFGTVPFWLGLGLIVLGLLLLWTGYRRGWGWAILGGLFLGLGAALLLVIYAQLPAGQWTPLATVVVGLVVGLAVIFIRPEAEAVSSP